MREVSFKRSTDCCVFEFDSFPDMESQAPKVEYYSWQKGSDSPLIFRRQRRVGKSEMGRDSLMAWRKAPPHLTFPSPKLPGKGLLIRCVCVCVCGEKEWQWGRVSHAETCRGSPTDTVFDMPGHGKDSSFLEFREEPHALTWSETRAVHRYNMESFWCLPDRVPQLMSGFT